MGFHSPFLMAGYFLGVSTWQLSGGYRPLDSPESCKMTQLREDGMDDEQRDMEFHH